MPRWMKTVGVLFVCLAAGPLRGEELAAQIERVIHGPDYQQARWGILVVDAKTGQPVYAHQADKLFAPASVTKLYTCAAALLALGADHRRETPVYRRGEVRDGRLQGDLILVGQGDLTLGGRTLPDGKLAFRDHDHTYAGWLSTRTELTDTDPLAGLQSLARQVKAGGIRQIEGEVLVDTRLFERVRGTGSGPTTVTPIVVNDNLIDLLITPGDKVGAPAHVQMRPQTEAYRVEAQVETSAAGARPLSIRVEKVSGQRLKVTGKVPLGSPPLVRTFPVEDPALFARSLLIEALRREGIMVKADLLHPSKAELPAWDSYATLPRVAVHQSEPLAEVVKVVLKVSHNLYASTLPLLVALKHNQRTHKDGMQQARKLFKELGVDVERISLESGAGGGNGDRVTPRATVQLLQGMAKRPEFAVYKAGFPILGVDGTLVDVVGKDSPARGKVFAKTGTFGDTDVLNDRMLLRSKALAGVMTTAGGKELVFAIFVNDVLLPHDVEPAREGKVLGRICEILYAHDAPARGK